MLAAPSATDAGARALELLAAAEDGEASCRCVTLPTLIRLKRAAGRPKDLEAIAELEALRDEREHE